MATSREGVKAHGAGRQRAGSFPGQADAGLAQPLSAAFSGASSTGVRRDVVRVARSPLQRCRALAGSGKAPAELRAAGLITLLRGAGHQVVDYGDRPVHR